MAASTTKQVVLYRFDRLPVFGVVQVPAYLQNAAIELMTRSGTVEIVQYADLKALCFAAQPEQADIFTVSSVFERRPKQAGLWTRFTLRDGAELEGILPHNLLEWPEQGFLFVPPKASVARQRVFIPKAAVTSTDLRGVIGAAPSRPPHRTRRPADGQIELFG